MLNVMTTKNTQTAHDAAEQQSLISPVFAECLKKLRDAKDTLDAFYCNTPTKENHALNYAGIEDAINVAAWNIGEMARFELVHKCYFNNK